MPWPCFFVVIRIMFFKILFGRSRTGFLAKFDLNPIFPWLTSCEAGQYNLAIVLDKFAFLNMVFQDLE